MCQGRNRRTPPRSGGHLLSNPGSLASLHHTQYPSLIFPTCQTLGPIAYLPCELEMGLVWMAQATSLLCPWVAPRRASTAPSAGGWGNILGVIPGSPVGIMGRELYKKVEGTAGTDGLENESVSQGQGKHTYSSIPSFCLREDSLCPMPGPWRQDRQTQSQHEGFL